MNNDTYREGNLKLLEMMISQINDFIENTRHGDGPKSYVINEDEINKKLCSTSHLLWLLNSGVGHDELPNNEDIYSMDFFESINNYLDTKYKYEFYDIDTLMEMYGDLQCVYDSYNKLGYLPWDNKKEEEPLPSVIMYNGEYHVGSPCSYSYEYLEYVQMYDRHHACVYKITRVDPRADTPYDKRVMSRVVGIYTDKQYLLMITNTEKFWEKYIEPSIQELEEAKANFIKMQEAEDNEGTN